MGERTRVLLIPIEDGSGLAVFKQLTAEPVFTNADHPNGEEWTCGHCHDRVLVTDGVPEDFWGVAFRCGACGRLSVPPPVADPRRIAPSRTIVAPEGEYAISTVEGRNVAIAEERLWYRQRARHEAPRPAGQLITPADLRAREYELRGVLGRETFERLWKAHERARRSRTPPRALHPLMEMVEEVRRAEKGLDGPVPSLDASLLGTLDAALEMFHRWRRDHAFTSIRTGLVNPREAVHGIITLTVASYLQDAGNPVYLYEPTKGMRAGDLRLDLTPRTYAVAEVKTPERLFRPPVLLTDAHARRLLERQARSAGLGPGGQLDPLAPGVLIVGGWLLNDEDLERLERAAARLLADRPRWTHVLGFVVAGVTVEARGLAVDQTGQLRTTVGSSMSGAMRVLPVLNPHYRGDVNMNTAAHPAAPGLVPFRSAP